MLNLATWYDSMRVPPAYRPAWAVRRARQEGVTLVLMFTGVVVVSLGLYLTAATALREAILAGYLGLDEPSAAAETSPATR